MPAELQGPAADLLLAEDDPEDRFMILRALRRARPGLRVAEVRDGIEAVEYLEAHIDAGLPRLVLLDLNMPRLSGREVLVAMRADARLRGLPVAVLSTSIEPEDVRSVETLGVSTFLSKPEGFAQLLQMMENLLRDHLGRAPGTVVECASR